MGASGDSGAADCDYPTSSTVVSSATHGLAVDVPASIPNVTGIGGTQFSDTSNASLYWASVNNSLNGSALSYIPELAWNETSAELALGGSIAASGGGVSTFFTKPAWQTGTGVPSDGFRDVPDLSFHASFDSDGYLVCSENSCVNGYRASDNTLNVVGGTSAGVPAFAGIVAMLNQATGSRQGNVNLRLYQLAAASADAFHDIVSGNNIVPCTAGSTGCPSTGQIGYSAGTGYDLATGLGTINAYNLVSEWNSSTTSTPSAADFALSASANTLSITRGSSGSLTVSVQALNGFSKNVTLACAVPSTLANVTCSAAPSAVTANGTVTVTISASTQTASNLRPPSSSSGPFFALLPVAGCMLLLSSSKRLRKVIWTKAAWFSIGLALTIGLVATGCGGSGSNSNSTTGSNTPTTSTPSGSSTGTETVVIQGTSGADVHVVAVSLTVS